MRCAHGFEDAFYCPDCSRRVKDYVLDKAKIMGLASPENGMNPRDMFAMSAAHAMLSFHRGDLVLTKPQADLLKTVAEASYYFADAMLIARELPNPGQRLRSDDEEEDLLDNPI